MIHSLSNIFALFIQCATVVTLIYALIKFTRKPNQTQNARLDHLEKKQSENERQFKEGKAHFQMLDNGNRAVQKGMLALLDHAIDGDHIENLIDAKEELQHYLINK